MTDPTYDPVLASRLRAYAEGGVRPIDAARDRRGRDREPPRPPERATGADAPRGGVPRRRRGRGSAGGRLERRPHAADGFGRLRLRGRRAPIALARRPALERLHRARPAASRHGRLPGRPAFRLGRDAPRRRRPRSTSVTRRPSGMWSCPPAARCGPRRIQSPRCPRATTARTRRSRGRRAAAGFPGSIVRACRPATWS